jgi:signal transduction histidine kinase
MNNKEQQDTHIQAEMTSQQALALNNALGKLCKSLFQPAKSIASIRSAFLKQAIELTQSKQGYVSEIDLDNDDNIVYILPELKNMVVNVQETEKREIRFQRGADGRYPDIWGHCLNTQKSFYSNSPKDHPAFEGYRQERFPIERFLSVPVMLTDEAVGQIALANKKEDYTDQDLATIRRLSELYAVAVERKRWEKALLASEKKKMEEAGRMRRALLSILEDEKLAKNKIKASEEALKESQCRLQLLSSHLLNVQEKEWRRLAFELHDDLGQSLSVLKLKLRDIKKRQVSADSAGFNVDCDQVNAYVDHIIDKVRRLSHDLCPSCIEDLGLDESIIMLAEEFSQHTHLKVTIETDPLGDLFQLQDQTYIYRIVQESLNNIQKHANARNVSIKVERRRSHVDIQIADDGIGFNKQGNDVKRENEVGLGLTAMEERAWMMGGKMNVVTSIGSGTRIEVNIPFECREA